MSTISIPCCLQLLLLLVWSLRACSQATPPQVQAALSAVEAVNTADSAGFARVTAPRPFVFPADHGPHPQYQTEWWYYTGNLRSTTGEYYGYQFTIFRRALTPTPPERTSAWGTQNIYMAHLAVSDVANQQFYAYERFSRDAAGLAGATGDPFRIFLEDWSVEGSGPEGMRMRLHAAEAEIALDLVLESLKPPVLQGDQGLSQKGTQAGNASYYYSLTRMQTTGTLSIAGEVHTVHGLSWMDHEFGTSALEGDAIGWDWFSIQLDDGRDLMYAEVRGATGPQYAFGSLVAADGTARTLAADEVVLTVLDRWRSPRSQALYPARWRLTLPDEGLTLELIPRLADQELPLTIVYWEGSVHVSGTQNGQPVQGHGYVELTGYAEAAPEGYPRQVR